MIDEAKDEGREGDMKEASQAMKVMVSGRRDASLSASLCSAGRTDSEIVSVTDGCKRRPSAVWAVGRSYMFGIADRKGGLDLNG